MKTIIAAACLAALLSCNNSKKQSNIPGEKEEVPTTKTTSDNRTATTGGETSSITINGKDMPLHGSVLVSKDKDKLQPGADYFAMLTASGGPNEESLVLNFLLALQPGSYPVVGMSLSRGTGDNSELYGGLLGGKPKLTDYKVNLTEVKDLGSNNLGGHRWSISGNFGELVIPAMGIMTMDKSKNHPAEVRIEKGSFANLTFEDNWEELMKKAMDQMQNKNK